MRVSPFLLLLCAPALVSATDPLTAARAEARAAEREAARLERAAASAGDRVQRLRAEQAAAAQEVLAAEARIAEAEAEGRAIARALAARSGRLARLQRPAALLLGAVAQMGRRPPLLTVADGTSPRELVTVRALLDTSLPAMRARTAALRLELEKGRQLAAAAQGVSSRLFQTRALLQQRQHRLAALERQANTRLDVLGGEALEAGDQALALGIEAERLNERDAAQRSAARLAAELGRFPGAPRRPSPPESQRPPAAFRWRLPVAAPVTTGLAQISPAGVRSRGLTFATARGATVLAPASGRIAFAGPFRRHDGVVIVDHGGGWMTLMTEVRTRLPVGSRVRAGDPLGAALGPVTVELTLEGRPQPAALIAGSSAALSNGMEAD